VPGFLEHGGSAVERSGLAGTRDSGHHGGASSASTWQKIVSDLR
jgi:hypothetical protein